MTLFSAIFFLPTLLVFLASMYAHLFEPTTVTFILTIGGGIIGVLLVDKAD